jgi:hypothetical protein
VSRIPGHVQVQRRPASFGNQVTTPS